MLKYIKKKERRKTVGKTNFISKDEKNVENSCEE